MKIHQRKNRKTKHIVELHMERVTFGHRNYIDLYWCRCTRHSRTDPFRTARKSNALHAMAHPDEWCPECKAALRNEP